MEGRMDRKMRSRQAGRQVAGWADAAKLGSRWVGRDVKEH